MTLRARISTLLALAGAGALGTSGTAIAADYQLTMSGPSTAAVGQPAVYQVHGQNPPPTADPFLSWLDVDAIPMSVTQTCYPDHFEAGQIALSAGGQQLAYLQPEHVDPTGQFTLSIVLNRPVPGPVLLCAYTEDGADNTLAVGGMGVNVTTGGGSNTGGGGSTTGGGGSSTGASVKNLARPRVTRSRATLTCSRGRWSTTIVSYAYRWLIDGQPKPRTNAARLRVTRSMRGHTVKCSVTASAAGSSASATSVGLRIH